MPRQAPTRAYHHGDLRAALLREAVRVIGEVGPGEVSLRELARRVGVSHAAPAHHFGDKAGLLTAVAAEGFRLLADELEEAYRRTGDVLDVGAAYVGFAARHRPYFDVMFRSDLYRADDADLGEARDRVRELFYAPFATAAAEGDERTVAGMAAWSVVHGVAALFVSGNLPDALGEDPRRLAEMVAPYLVNAGS